MSPKQARKSRKKAALEPEDVARLAYAYWEERGRPDGSSDEDWYRAEEELRKREDVEPADPRA